MTSLSTLRDSSWSICGEQEGECMRKLEGEGEEEEKWPGRFYSFIHSGFAGRLGRR